ncbi:hypothetical protein F7Q99_36200 [Streptomyces kaniharaensis]|uniref:Uncharacterized protein n=1 Tax=Streptomyces kaniharaensis TaxID=212423 RepID=A0A6N7L2R0_9ACTN|nr:hypothetical protein [Streptomyces kaniharaensis]MQS17485.1 hypothetical protein [Streptomyces kaniharaensis]
MQRSRHYGTHVLTARTFAPSGYEPAAFKETVISERHDVGYLTAWEADLMIGRAAAKSRPINVLEQGALSIGNRARDGRRLRGYARTLELVVHPKKLTPRQHEDLLVLAELEHRARVIRDQKGFIAAIDIGFHRIARTQASILLDRGWLAMIPHTDQVWISAAGRMALAYRWHTEQGLHWRVLKGLYLDAALTAAATATARTAQRAEEIRGKQG